jgi:uncharacterized RDD family membrane protein YckC
MDETLQQETAAAPVQPGRIAGFWIRFLADLLDAVFLGIVGRLLAIPFRSLFVRLGERGVFIGLAISLVYSGVLQSRYGGGRTPGKRLLGLRVVRPAGTLLSLDRSLVRYALMGLLVYGGAVAYVLVALLPFLGLERMQIVMGAITGALAFGCVLVVPFHPLKRGLHDLLADTIVIRGALPDPAFIAARMNARRDRRIIVGSAALGLIAVAGSIAFSHRLSASAQAKDLPILMERLSALGVSSPSVGRTTIAQLGGPTVVTLMGSGFIARPADGGEPAWDQLHTAFVQAAKAQLPTDSGVDRIGTALRTGFNIGIYRSYEVKLRIDDARTGQSVQSSDTSNF